MATISRPVSASTTWARSLAGCALLGLLGAVGVRAAAAQAPVVVFPDSATVAPRLLSSGPYQASFLVQHKGEAEGLEFACRGTGGVTCTGIAPAPARGPQRTEPSTAEATASSATDSATTAPATAARPAPEFTCTKAETAALTCSDAEPTRGRLGQGRVTRVVVTYTVSALGLGTLVLQAQGETSRQAATGRLTIPIVAAVDSTGTVAPDTSSTGTPSTGQ